MSPLPLSTGVQPLPSLKTTRPRQSFARAFDFDRFSRRLTHETIKSYTTPILFLESQILRLYTS